MQQFTNYHDIRCVCESACTRSCRCTLMSMSTGVEVRGQPTVLPLLLYPMPFETRSFMELGLLARELWGCPCLHSSRNRVIDASKHHHLCFHTGARDPVFRLRAHTVGTEPNDPLPRITKRLSLKVRWVCCLLTPEYYRRHGNAPLRGGVTWYSQCIESMGE